MALGDEQIDRLLSGLQTWSDDFIEKVRLLVGGIKINNSTSIDARKMENALPADPPNP